MRRRFTIFELSIVLLSLAVLATIAVPDVTIRDREAGEAAAVRALVRLAVEAYAAPSDAAAPRPRELGALLDRAGLAAGVDGASVRLGAYRFALFGPGPHGRPVPAPEAGVPATGPFLLLAWPARPGETGVRAYGVDESLVVFEYPGEMPVAAGGRPPPIPLPRLTPVPGRPWPVPWRPLLPRELPEQIRATLVARGLPVPESLAASAGE